MGGIKLGRKKKGAPQKLNDIERARIEIIWTSNYQYLFYLARKRNIPETECDDLVQNCIAKLSQQKGKLRSMSDADVRAYLVSAIQNECNTWYRKQARQQQTIEKIAANGTEESDSQETELITRLDNKNQITHIMGELTEQERNLLIGKIYLELSDEEVAESIGCQPQSVRSMVSRAKKKAHEAAEKLKKEGV